MNTRITENTTAGIAKNWAANLESYAQSVNKVVVISKDTTSKTSKCWFIELVGA